MKRFIAAFIFFCFSLHFAGAQKVYSDYVDGVIYFKLKTQEAVDFTVNSDKTISSSSNLSFLKEMTNEFGIRKLTCPLASFGSGYFAQFIFVYFDSIYKVDLLLEELLKKEIVELTSKEPIMKAFSAPPTDTYYRSYGSTNLKWHLDLINAEGAWSIAKGSPNIRVGVVDNAVWGQHPDLQIPDSLQYSVVSNNVGNSAPPLFVNQNESCTEYAVLTKNCPAYEWSHGTHCAGLVGAVTNNGSGVASIGGGVTLLGIRCTRDGDSLLSDTKSGVAWAISKGAKVVSMSFGGSVSDPLSSIFYDSCYNAGIILVAAAGNDGVRELHYPAAYRGVISVASTNSDKRLSSFSQYGDWVSIAAPGGFDRSGGAEMFSSTFSKNVKYRNIGEVAGQYYDGMQGTSMACPVAAGLCGLMLSRNPNLTPDQVKEILQKTATPIPEGNKIDTTSGLINAYAVMQSVDSTMPKALFTATTPTTGLPSLSVSFASQSIGSSKYETSTISSYKWYFQRGTTDTTSTDANPTIIYTTPGMYTVTLVVTDSRGIKDSLTKENYVNVTVPATPLLLRADKDSLSLNFYKSATSAFNVISNVTAWTINNTNTWLTVTPNTGDDNATISVSVVENTDTMPRTGSIILTDGTISDTVIVTQKGGLRKLDVDVNATTIPKGGGNTDASVVISSNVTWSITNSSSSWLTVSPTSGIGNQTLTISAGANTTAQERIGRILVSGGGITKQITITQERYVTTLLDVSPTTLTFESDSGLIKTFTISTNVNWTIAPSETLVWLDVEPRSGEPGTSIEITVKTMSKNTAGSNRNKNLDVVVEGLAKTVAVTQKKGVGISETEKAEQVFNIYPNPFSNIINIENKTTLKIKELSVIDLTGKMLLKKDNIDPSKTIQLQLENLTKGIYLLKIETLNGKVQYRKLVKN